MGLCDSGDTFRAKVDKIIGDIEGVKAYINDILVLGKVIFSQRIYQLRDIFYILHSSVLKLNNPNCRFWLKEIHCLGYIITWEGVKPDLKKL